MEPVTIRLSHITDFGVYIRFDGLDLDTLRPVTVYVDHSASRRRYREPARGRSDKRMPIRKQNEERKEQQADGQNDTQSVEHAYIVRPHRGLRSRLSSLRGALPATEQRRR